MPGIIPFTDAFGSIQLILLFHYPNRQPRRPGQEVLGRSALGVMAFKHEGSGWTQLPGIAPLSNANGWDERRFYETIQTADLDGDGRAELLGRGAAGLAVRELGATGWAAKTPTLLPLSDDGGWSHHRFYRLSKRQTSMATAKMRSSPDPPMACPSSNSYPPVGSCCPTA